MSRCHFVFGGQGGDVRFVRKGPCNTFVCNYITQPSMQTGATQLVRFPFRFPAHIEFLEAQGLLSYIRLCVREGWVSQRIIVVVDSGVVKEAVLKFRSSSRGLNFALRQLVRFCGLLPWPTPAMRLPEEHA